MTDTTGDPLTVPGTAVRRFAAGGVVRLAGYGTSTALSVVTAALTLRYLGPTDAGIYYEALSIVAIAASFSEAGLGAIALREYALAPPTDRRHVLSDVLSLRLVLLLIGLVLVVGWLPVTGEVDALFAASVVAGVATIVLVAQSTLQVPLLADGRVRAATAVQVGVAVAGAVVVAALVGLDAPLAPFLGVFVPGALVGCAVTARLIRPVEVRLGWRPAAWRSLLAANLEYGISAVLGVIWFRSAPIVVAAVADATQAGFYGVAFRVVDGFETIGPLLLAVALPDLSRLASRSDPERLRARVAVLTSLMTAAGCAVGVGTFVAAPSILRLLAGDEFAGAGPTLRILATALPLAFALQTCGYVLLALRRHRYLLVAMVVAVVTVLPAMAIGTSESGARGAAVALVASHALVLLVYGFGLLRSVGQPTTLVADLAVLVGLGVIVGAAGFAAPLPDLVAGAVATTVYVAGAGAWLIIVRHGAGSGSLIARLRALVKPASDLDER